MYSAYRRYIWGLLELTSTALQGCVAHTLQTTALDLRYDSLLNSFKKKREAVTFQLHAEYSVRNFMDFLHIQIWLSTWLVSARTSIHCKQYSTMDLT